MTPHVRSVVASLFVVLAPSLTSTAVGAETTYAERLGFEPGQRLVILHVDDAGMSHDSNVGAMRAVTEGAANSMSVMMPCSWVPELAHMLRAHPGLDVGLHLTLTSEWEHYRWGPLVGAPAAPGLVDTEGAMWRSVELVVANAGADEVEAEIRAQIARARSLGIEPTHLDSHMGTLFATPAFLERYIAVGVETGIPIMFPGGHNTLLRKQYRDEAVERLERLGKWDGTEPPPPPELAQAPEIGKQIWAAGLPVLDDLHNTSYGWVPEEGAAASAEALRELKVERYSEALRSLGPGVTMVILHATDPGPHFDRISSSGPTRKGDLLAMLDPRIERVLEEEGIGLTTWRELGERRRAVGAVGVSLEPADETAVAEEEAGGRAGVELWARLPATGVDVISATVTVP
jgi:hypothetical protein